MGSINPLGSTLNSINQSLLTELKSYLPSTSSATSGSSTAASSDSVNFSQVGQLFQDLQQLQTTDPAALKKVLQDAATKFSRAAQQATDPTQANFLNSIADKFQKAADTGDLSALKQPSSSTGTSATYGHHHHHHHAGGVQQSSPTSTTDQSGSSTGTSATSPTTEDLLASLFSQSS